MPRITPFLIALSFSFTGVGCSAVDAPEPSSTSDYAAHIASEPAWVVAGGQGSAALGLALASGDLTGDGTADLVLGMPGLDDGQSSEGGVFLFAGDGVSYATTALWSYTSNEPFAFLGGAVSIPGDLNDDTFSDLVVGSWQADGATANEGRVEVFYGGPAGLAAVPDVVIDGGQAGASFGFSLAGGDVNGDGVADLLVGAPDWSETESSEGAVFWFAGSSAGLSSVPSGLLAVGSAGASFGYSVAVPGDVDQDGDDDILVGSPEYSDVEVGEGRALLFHGDPLGPTASAIWEVESDQLFARMGHSVAGAGDVNGDGHPDLLVGTPWFDGASLENGQVDLWFGATAPPALTSDWSWEGPQSGGLAGVSVAGAGDLNGDGVDDLAVGASHADIGVPDEGLLFVFPGLLGTEPSAQPGRVISLGGLLAQFGSSIASAGDANGDGFDDLLVGGWNFSSAAAGEGVATLLLGVPATVDIDMDGFCVNPAGCVAGIPGGDCNDFDPARYPGAPELCDGVDQDCDGALPLDEQDSDGDGWMSCAGDCNDFDAGINPDAAEICDLIDHDCDGLPDNGLVPPAFWPDGDGDGHGDPLGTPIQTCGNVPEGYVSRADDCDDDDPSLSPSEDEITCTGIDEDCSFLTPDVEDRDGDAFTPCGDCQDLGTTLQCGDCDDVDQDINPYMSETCGDGIDQNCDGIDPECALPPVCNEPDNICEEVSCACASVRGLNEDSAPPALLALLLGVALLRRGRSSGRRK
jgi:hypothetical protein